MKLQDLIIVEANGEYSSFKSWKAAIKKKHPDAWIEGDEDIAQAMVGPRPFKRGETKSVGEWDGAKGELYEDMQQARNAAEAGRGQSARDFKRTSYSSQWYWKDDAKEKGYTIKKVGGELMKGNQTWHAFKDGTKVGEFTEKEEGRGGWLVEGRRGVPEALGQDTVAFDKYKKIAVKHGWKQRADHLHHPLHGTVEVNRHGEWLHLPHGSLRDADDGFGGSNEVNFEKHLKHLSMNESLMEAVQVDGEDRYEFTHKKRPSGRGTWMFSKHKNIDFSKHKEGEDYFQSGHNDLYSDAKKKAREWATAKKHAVIYVQT